MLHLAAATEADYDDLEYSLREADKDLAEAEDILGPEEAAAPGVNANNGTLCSNLSNDHVSESCKFWIQGVCLTLIGTGGIIGNLVSKYV